MRMLDSAFLCLDIGTCGVRGIAHRVRNAMLDKSAYYSVDDFDTVFALKSVIDELEHQIGRRFDTAYITGNFGPSYFSITTQGDKWSSMHKITAADIKSQIAKITSAAPENFFPMHIVPLRYDTPRFRNMLSPIGHSDRQLVSTFAALFFNTEYMQKMLSILRQAHIQPDAFYAPHFIANSVHRKPGQNIMFLDMGAENTTLSVWSDRGPVWYMAHAIGGNDLTDEISKRLSVPFIDAERIKRAVASLKPNEMARFSPADSAYAFSCADVNDIVVPFYTNLINQLKSENDIEKYAPSEIILTGGGAQVEGVLELLTNVFNLPIKKLDTGATVRALSEFIWRAQKSHRTAYIARMQRQRRAIKKIFSWVHFHKKKKRISIPIMPSTLCFDMTRPETYTMFRAGGIQAIHVDIMDGLYVNNIAGSLDELQRIRTMWNGHLHVHLMTESPEVWATGAINAGADTVILSTNTVGLRKAVQIVRQSGKRIGIALNPDSSVSLLKSVLRDLDEVMVMAVAPGAAGQTFDKNIVHKISVLDATRKKYGLKFVISVDGGINAETAQLCWASGADVLVSGSYLGSAPDFPLAVLSLLPKSKN